MVSGCGPGGVGGLGGACEPDDVTRQNLGLHLLLSCLQREPFFRQSFLAATSSGRRAVPARVTPSAAAPWKSARPRNPRRDRTVTSPWVIPSNLVPFMIEYSSLTAAR